MIPKPKEISAAILLDVRSAWLVEFAAALAREVEVIAYSASSQIAGRFFSRLGKVSLQDPLLEVTKFPVQRGYFSFPLWYVVPEHRRIAKWVTRGVEDPGSTWLVCCYPHYSKVTALWPGPVVYYATDLFAKYSGRSYRNVRKMETELCRRASLVCPNSRRVADYLVSECACEASKILILPNAVRQANLLANVPETPLELPADSMNPPRPVAGVIGNMGANVDWCLLEQIVPATPWLSWLMVGPTGDRIDDPAQSQARARLLAAGGNIRFIGARPYGELKHYARGMDAAVLPYRRREPTYSGSSTRYYEHLAACRPILATDGFEELLHFEPLLRILRTPAEWIDALEQLRKQGFRDGVEELRWRQSRDETWEKRAQSLCGVMMTHQAVDATLAIGAAS